MLRYSNHNYEKKPVRKSHEKTKSNKRKSKKEIVTSTGTENNSSAFNTLKTHNKHEEFEGNEAYFKIKPEKNIPQTWKDSWKRPLNQNIIIDEDGSSDKIRTNKINRRQYSRKTTYVADMISMDY